MKISSVGEFGLIEKIKKIVANDLIGHDTAPIKIGKETVLITCDVMIEKIHFLKNYPPETIGFKSISVNVSDIVASGGHPQYILVSLMLPDIDTSFVDCLYQGMMKACKKYHCQIVGGNISRAQKIGIDIFVIGRTSRFVGRDGAEVGDDIYITGYIGDSKAGLELLKSNKKKYLSYEKTLITKHLQPIVDIKIGKYISHHANTALDISDGFSSDIAHLSERKHFAFHINSGMVPISPELKKYCQVKRLDPLSYAMSGGEDYRVLFTQRPGPSPYIKIGKVKKGNGIYLDGKKLNNKSFSHF